VKKGEVKTIHGSYRNENKEFIGIYLDGIKDGKSNEWRVGIWNFWYLNMIIKFEGVCKDGILVSKKYQNSKGQSIKCSLLEISVIET
tara:strand:- start:1386 stop:1646 length:261 start_codon:yes stop_codon:yes gene_type:complete